VSTDEITGGFDADNVTRHAVRRLGERATLSRETAALAWHSAEWIDINRTSLDGDEARYNDLLRVVLVRKDSALVTIIDADTANHTVIKELKRSTGWTQR
jgi:hypothetical protein